MVSRVLVGVDFSDGSKAALDQAGRWASKLGVPLVVLHVLQPPSMLFAEGFPMVVDITETRIIEEHALEHLYAWTQDLPGAKPQVVWGLPAETLVHEADPDTLLVVGQTGHSRLEQFLFGSTASKAVRLAPCDVLVVRSEQWPAA